MKRFTSFAAFLILVAMGSLFCGCQYIDALNYTVTYDDGVADADIAVPIAASYTIGATVPINFEEIGDRPGYIFKCWSDGAVTYTKGNKEGFVMGMADITLTAIWELIPAPQPEPEPEPEAEPEPQPEPAPEQGHEPQPEPDPQQDPQPDPQPEQPPAPVYANYKIKHYKQNANDDDYTLDYTTNRTGIAGQQTSAYAYSYQHYTAQPFEQAVIEEDGSTEIRIYYNLETITYTLILDGGSIDSETGTVIVTGKYGQRVNIPNPTWEGHYFECWNGSVTTYGRLPETFVENARITALWISGNIVVTLSASDLSVTKTVTDTTIKLTPISGFSNYTWKIDGANATSIRGVTVSSGYTLNIPVASLTQNAVYQVTLTATRNGIPYSTQISIRY